MIVSMYGTCDGKEILFGKVTEEQWTCEVPADFADGTYVVEIWAALDNGDTIYTTAILYMCDSKFASLEMMDDGIEVRVLADVVMAHVESDRYIVRVVKRCM